MAIHRSNESEELVGHGNLDFWGWLWELVVSPVGTLCSIEEFFSNHEGTFFVYLKARVLASELLETSVRVARMWPQYVILTDYHICLGHNTFWIRNWPSIYGAVHIEGNWVPSLIINGRKVIDSYFSMGTSTPVLVCPSVRAKRALKKFIEEYTA